MEFNVTSWMLKTDKQSLKDSVLELLNAVLKYRDLPYTEENYNEVRGILFALESLQWIPGGVDYLLEGYKKDKEVVEKFKEVDEMLKEMQKEIWKGEPGVEAIDSEPVIPTEAGGNA